MSKYVIGVDFGSLSARALLINATEGKEIAESEYKYPHGIMNKGLEYWAIQDPKDYLEALSNTVFKVLEKSKIEPKHIKAIGIDFTSSTLIPIKKDGTPLCFLDKYKDEKHAFAKLWKHHATSEDADKLNKVASERKEDFLKRYGMKISSEWLIPKVMQIIRENKEIYDEANMFIEAADWIVYKLTGNVTRNSCSAGYKALWSKKNGYPSNDFYKNLDPSLDGFVENKLYGKILMQGQKAGEITKEGAKLTGLIEGTSVASGNVDAHVTFPAAGITKKGSMLMIIGTSTCHMLISDKEKFVPGICGVVEDGILQGYYGYESGQSCVGDQLNWFIDNMLPEKYMLEAKKRKIDIFSLLEEKLKVKKAKDSSLIALDWLNGNRSVLVDANLKGMILGLTLDTKPEDIYKALIEATAYGTRKIIENYVEHGIEVNKIYAAGGISQKSKLFMQIYADVIGMDISIVDSKQAPAYGSAIYASVACGIYDNIFEATKKLGKTKKNVFKTNKNEKEVYDKLYNEYVKLHDYFGKGINNVMKKL